MTAVRDVAPLRLPFDAAPALPGSKSWAHRMLILAALGEGETLVENATPGDDVAATRDGLAVLGFSIATEDAGHGTIRVRGGLPARAGAGTIACGEGGAVLRFLSALAALVPGTWTLAGHPRLGERPMAPLVGALRALGATVEEGIEGALLRVSGGGLRGGRVRLDASASSQFASALMLAAPRLDAPLEITFAGEVGSPGYLELTRAALAACGVAVRVEANSVRVEPGPVRPPARWRVPGDWSAAGAFLVLAEMTGSRLERTGLDDPVQADAALPGLIRRIADAPAGETVVLDARQAPDQVMNLAVLACRRAGRTRFEGVSYLAGKECDRPAVLVRELGRAGLDLRLEDDALVVDGGSRPVARRFETEGDHRMAMAFAIVGALVPGCSVTRPDCVAKSHPGFWDELETCRRSPRPIALIGMPGAGKSTLAPALAAALGLPAVDLDRAFEEEHGAIFEVVRDSGWPYFRARESELLARHLRPGRVVACGGGVVESPDNRALLAERALVVFLDEDLETLVRRVIARPGRRPAVVRERPEDDLRALHARRDPVHRALARVIVPPTEGADARLAATLEEIARTCSW